MLQLMPSHRPNAVESIEMSGPSGKGPTPGEDEGLLLDPSLYNEDLRPIAAQSWSTYNLFAVWMSIVHNLAAYLIAGSLFSLRLASWQVLIALISGVCFMLLCHNLVSRPCFITAVPYPVINRAVFGIRGAKITGLLRGPVHISWYGIQTYLASRSLVLVLLRFFPGLEKFNLQEYGFVGLPLLGWLALGSLWAVQAMLFWRRIEAIRRIIDWAGPAVYLVMLALAVSLVSKAGWRNVNLNLSEGEPLSLREAIPVMLSAIALVCSNFSGTMLIIGDFSRYAKSWRTVKLGNFLGLPVNYVFFAVLTVVTTSATKSAFGEMVSDPIEVMHRLDSPLATVLGGLTFVVATIGINIAGNFIPPAFDFSNLAPHYISWRGGGMITAVLSVLITPWNWYNNPQAILYSLTVLAAMNGPLFGVLVAGYYMVSKQKVWVPDMYSMQPNGRYWFLHGFNPNAVAAILFAGACSVTMVLLPKLLPDWGLGWANELSWFVGSGFAFCVFVVLERWNPRIRLGADTTKATDGHTCRGYVGFFD